MFDVLLILLILFLICLIILILYRCMKSKNRIPVDVKAAILNREELEKHAKEIALDISVSAKEKSCRRLLPRMEDNYNYIIRAYKELNSDLVLRNPVAPAAEWLFDNFYVIEEQIKEIRLTFPKGYYANLPSLTSGSMMGFPRVYNIAIELISHTDGRIDEKLLLNFIKSYQSKSQLTSGELWAIPIMLRIALIENIRVICEDILKSQDDKRSADRLSDTILSKENEGYDKIIEAIKEYTSGRDTLSPAFAEHLLSRLRKHGTEAGPIMHHIDELLLAQDTTAEDIIQIEHQEEAKNQVSIGNSITSLRFVSSLEWSEIFEDLSPVEQILRSDIDGVYSSMDFDSRDYYRHEIEAMARALHISESQVARKAIECAKDAENDEDRRKSHVGFYIVGKGREKLEAIIGYKPGIAKRIKRSMKSKPTSFYLNAVIIIVAVLTAIFTIYTYNRGSSAALALLTAIVVLFPVSEIAIGVVNWLITHTLPPSFLSKMELKKGVGEDNATMIVIPTLLSNENRVKELLSELEVYYLANQEVNLFFALLGDFTDAQKEHMPNDESIVNVALKGVKKLNSKYAKDKPDIFYFFHRYRKFNPKQGMWMGWERKRGKLVEFNELLRGASKTTYYIQSGDIKRIPSIKYVITLDADTELPRGAAKKLIGTISHPLNRAVVDEKKGRVVEGYGILQPRVSIGVINANKTKFSRVYAGQGGIDPYTTAVSDVYQDLFGEGIYTGKGIYDIDVFQKVLDGYIPENAVLSHDLLEGSYTRAGLVTDIEFVDGFPSKYSSYAARMHRWVRGDWQLLPWLMPRVLDSRGKYVKNPLSAISRWKIFDNMRRSLIPPSLIVLIFLAFGILPGRSSLWLCLAAFTIGLPVFLDMADAVFSKHHSKTRSYTVLSGLKSVIYQIVLMFVFLPYRAYLMIDAIVRTIIRLYIAKKNLLEWETAADAENRLKNDAKSSFSRMWVSLVIAVLLLAEVITLREYLWPVGSVFVILWILSPSIAYWISKNSEDGNFALSEEDTKELRRLFRKTWRYFEEFASPLDNYLPPDNYQQEPPNGIAHRTSPTNIGLYLLAVLCARDMGYICTAGVLKRLEHTFKSLERLDMWRGHFYNWYDTRTLQPLRPLYVSTVDSGNFVGYIIALKEGLKEYMEKPLANVSLALGIADTVELMCEEVGEGAKDVCQPLLDILSIEKYDYISWYKALSGFKAKKGELDRGVVFDGSSYSSIVDSMVDSFMDELSDTMPWISLIVNMPEELKEGGRLKAAGSKILSLVEKFNDNLSPIELSTAYKDGMTEFNKIASSVSDKNGNAALWLKEFKGALMNGYLNINKVLSTSKNLEERCQAIFDNTEFKPLFEEKRQLFSIGYSIEEEQINRSYYDLLASEARMTSLIAIAKGDVDQKHWFRLGRQLVPYNNYKGLVSWSGTMFEYLMPLLTMKNYKNTLMDETYSFVIRCQKAYAEQRNVPWGVSESGYHGFDMDFNYQYKAFGVPRLGLKRGLSNDMVVAPYSTILALMVDPISAIKNINILKDEGMEGPYGLYEAVDYTPGRVPVEKKGAIVKSFMAHHHGMSLLSIDNVLNSNIIQERFHRDPKVRAAELLLQEKVPGKIVLTKDIEDEVTPLEKALRKSEADDYIKIIKEPQLPFPEAHVISNGNYSTVLTNSGTGFSKTQGTMVNRWREDVSLDNYGMFFYIQNINSNMVWSAAFEPYRVMPEDYRVIFSPDKVEYFRVDGSIDTHTEIVVSPEDNAEVRRISLTNHSDHARVVEVTSYFEVVISPPSADMAHPAFNKLFVRTKFLSEYDSLLATRRPRSVEEKPVWLMHAVAVEGETVGGTQYETDRARFIGRNRDVSDPEALDVDHPLSNTSGAVIDPIMSLRRRVRIHPGETVRVSYTTGVSDTKDRAVMMAQKYHDPSSVRRAFELAWTRSQVEYSYLNLRSKEIGLYQKMISHILYISPLRKMREDIIKRNVKGQSGLWPQGISGDIPIVLVSVSRSDEADIVHDILKAHEYWRAKGLAVDLVILNEDESSYIQSLQNLLNDIVSSSHARDIQNRPGGVFVRQSGMMAPEERDLLYSTARIVLRGDGGPIAKQIKLKFEDRETPIAKENKKIDDYYPSYREPSRNLVYFNGYGGFSQDGKEYVIEVDDKKHTPAPWVNVISNESFGCLVTESGSGYTFAENSREFKITPWSNDPVIDPAGEIVYLKDKEAGSVWSITPQPIREKEPYTVRHGFGYSIFEHISSGLKQEMTVFVPENERVKVSLVKLKNISGKPRKLSAVYYIKPVLGVSDQVTMPFIVTELEEESKVVLVRNTYSDDFPGRIVSLDSSITERSVTGDRSEFIGRKKTMKEPAALYRDRLSGRVGAGFDPCAAVQVDIELEDGEEKEIAFTLGEGINAEEVVKTALKYRNIDEAKKAYDGIKKYWEKKLETVQVATPDASLNIMMNGWLLYQTISSRLRARSAFYQSGGAYGFRDQLQDVMSVAYISPDTTKNQILYSASHQFLEGDVQHWWHPVTDKGIRTKFSDDLLWLPFVTSDYLEITKDTGILDIETGFLEDEPLGEREDERYNKPKVSGQKSNIYDHCIRAIERSLKFGLHGIPLMGSGDWNDGMSTVGNKGRGESVWLGWFLYLILNRFVPICRMRGDDEMAERYIKVAGDIADSIEKNAWDGSWYRRAYFDDGTPLGSAANTECQIDSLAQSWSIISGGGKHYRSVEAMGALEHYLVKKNEGLIMLLTPPFDKSSLEPGYIKGYVPGVRENGGQYTHAAVWVVLAFAMLGNGNRAWELFNMINPINHGRTPTEAAIYKVEPYVMAADVYAVDPHTGRGGWTWYTGAAGWMYRVCIENILGLKLRGNEIVIDPCIPGGWGEYTMKYRYMDTDYLIKVKNPNSENVGVKKLVFDSRIIQGNAIAITNDRQEHHIEVTL